MPYGGMLRQANALQGGSLAPFTIVLLALAIAMSWWIRELEMAPTSSAVASTEADAADGE